MWQEPVKKEILNVVKEIEDGKFECLEEVDQRLRTVYENVVITLPEPEEEEEE